jgi:hypothetical protein
MNKTNLIIGFGTIAIVLIVFAYFGGYMSPATIVNYGNAYSVIDFTTEQLEWFGSSAATNFYRYDTETCIQTGPINSRITITAEQRATCTGIDMSVGGTSPYYCYPFTSTSTYKTTHTISNAVLTINGIGTWNSADGAVTVSQITPDYICLKRTSSSPWPVADNYVTTATIYIKWTNPTSISYVGDVTLT